MTYKQLAVYLASLTEEQLAMNVTVYLTHQDEFVASHEIAHDLLSAVLDDDHPVLMAHF